jgi:hypothetical protein
LTAARGDASVHAVIDRIAAATASVVAARATWRRWWW